MIRTLPLAGAAVLLAMQLASPAAAAPANRPGVAASPAPAAVTPRPARARTFINVKGDIWRAGNGNWWSLVYVTPDGIFIVDTINTDFATWLKAELAQRFPGKPVRYIIYSHTHVDHAGGAEVFADAHPHIVAQERALVNMDGRWQHMPGDMRDRNNNGLLEEEELVIPTLEHPGICGGGPGSFAAADREKAGHVTSGQWFGMNRMPKPDLVYGDRMKIVLGGRTIELVFPGLNHADDGTVAFFPAERVAFSVDFPADALVNTTMDSLPSACGAFDQHPMAEWIKSYRTIEDLDFDILAQGHGQQTFTKQDVTKGRQFFEDLRAAVSQGMAQGRSLEDMKQNLKMPKYQGWAFYGMLLPDNIEAAYLNLNTYR